MFSTTSKIQDKPKRILTTSLNPPKLQTIIERRKLLQELLANSDKNLILLQSAPGYGKTFLAAQFYSLLPNTIWISVAEDYFCLNELLLHIIYALDKVLSSESSNYLVEISHFLSTEELIVELINLLNAENQKDIYLFLDNYEHIKFLKAELEKLLDLLFSYLPTHVHVILISSMEITFPLAKYRLNNTLFQLKHNDFLLSLEEVDEFLSLHGVNLPFSELNKLHQLTHGWIGMLALLAPELKYRDTSLIHTALENNISPQQISHYLDYILAVLPEPEKDFLIQISIFPDFSLQLCNKYLPTTENEKLINQLKMKNFIQSYDSSYQIHHLLRTYLIGKIPHQNLLENYKKAAAIYYAEGDYKTTAYYLVKAEKIEEALKIILQHFQNWEFRSNLVHCNWLEQIPANYLATNPNLYYYHGLIKMYMAKYDEALSDLKNAKIFDDCTIDPVLLDINTARVYQFKGDHQQVIAICEKSLTSPHCTSNSHKAKVYQLMGGSLIELARYSEGKEFLQLALQHTEVNSEKIQEAWLLCEFSFRIFMPTGDFEAAMTYYNKAYTIFSEQNDHFGKAHTLFLKSLLLYEIQDFPECQKALEASEYIYNQLGHTKFLLYLFMLKIKLATAEGAYTCAEKSLEKIQPQVLIDDTQRINLSSTYCAFYIAKHDFAKANFWCEKGLDLAQHLTNKYPHLEFYLHQISIKFLLGDYPEVMKLTEISRQICKEHDFRFYLAQFSFYELAVLKLTNKLTSEEVKRFLNLVQKNKFLFLLTKFQNLSHILEDDICKYLKTAKKNTASPKTAPEKSLCLGDPESLKTTKVLKINMFGTFCITAGTKALTNASIKNKKAFNLLKYLILNRSSWIPQEKIIDIFWPEFELEKGRQNLYVTLYEVRKQMCTLTHNPRNVQYILSQNSCYKFNTDILYWLDLDDFDNFYHEGCYHVKNHNNPKAQEYFLKAKSLYSIGLLPDNCYEEWAKNHSEYYASLYITCLKNLFTLEKNTENAIPIGQEILDLEPFSEEISIQMVKLLVETGQQKKALQLCQRLKRIYNSELDLRLPREIEETLYLKS